MPSLLSQMPQKVTVILSVNILTVGDEQCTALQMSKKPPDDLIHLLQSLRLWVIGLITSLITGDDSRHEVWVILCLFTSQTPTWC